MKLTKMAGAFALTAAMAMAAVPAFAAPDATNVEDFSSHTANMNIADATTEVYVEYYNVDLNASIPTRVAVVIPSSGTDANPVKAPAATAYKIQNNGTKTIYVREVKSTSTNARIGLWSTVTNTTGVGSTVDMNVTFVGDGTVVKLDGNLDNNLNVAIAGGDAQGLQLEGTAKHADGIALVAGSVAESLMDINYTISTQARS